jgi:hypothetical protein
MTILFRKKDSLKQVIILNIVGVIFIAFYFAALQKSVSGSRISELGNKSFSSIVDNNRTHSISFPLEKIIENKYFENLFFRLTSTIGGMSANYLFINGVPESSGHLSIPDHGPLYPIDLIIVFIGLIYLFSKYTNKAIGLCFLIAITYIPNFLNIQNATYSIRPVILIPILIIITASGLFGLYESPHGKKSKIIILGIIVSIYLFFGLRFMFQYYFRMPIENNDSWFFQDRVAIQYIKSLTQKDSTKKIIWVTPYVHHSFYRYIFFSGLYTNTQDIRKINELLKSEIYSIGNLIIQVSCPKNYNLDTSFYLIDSTLNCSIPEVKAIIANINDAGAKYRFVDDPLCEQYTHNRYPLIKDFRLLNVENLTDEEFCVNHISNNQN